MSLRKAVKDVLDAYDKALEQDAHGDLASPIEALRQAYAEPYVPMTDDEFIALLDKSGTFNRYSGWEWEREIEAAVLARLGIEVGK